MDTQKIDDNTIEISEVVPEVVVKTQYERGFIENQIKTITDDRDNYVALRNKEIQDCNDILTKMDALNIVVKVEPIPEPVVE
jgi:hypothetical protein